MVPHQRNAIFFGRTEWLNTLNTGLAKASSQEQGQKSCVIHGIGGVGKTQLALEYIYRSESTRSYTFWLRAHDDPNLTESFVNIGRVLGLFKGLAHDLNEYVQVTKNWLVASMSRFLGLIHGRRVSSNQLL